MFLEQLGRDLGTPGRSLKRRSSFSLDSNVGDKAFQLCAKQEIRLVTAITVAQFCL